jgi:hypothetical protein
MVGVVMIDLDFEWRSERRGRHAINSYPKFQIWFTLPSYCYPTTTSSGTIQSVTWMKSLLPTLLVLPILSLVVCGAETVYQAG